MGRAGLKTCVKAVGSIESANEEKCLVVRHEVGELGLLVRQVEHSQSRSV